MELKEAVADAIRTGGTIRRKIDQGKIRIKPRLSLPFDVYMEDNSRPPAKNWNPTALDILRDDWEVLPYSKDFE